MFFFETRQLTAVVTVDEMDSERPESELVAEAVGGDEDAFVELANRYHTRVWATASRFARGRAEAEDLVQDLFVKIWKGLPTFQNKSPFEHWLMKVTVRGCYDHLRKHRKRRENEILTDEIVESGVVSNPGQVSSKDAAEIIAILMEKMEPKDRMVITLLDLEEKSVKETAELTGWSESNVKVRAHRARKKMRTLFGQLGLER